MLRKTSEVVDEDWDSFTVVLTGRRSHFIYLLELMV